MRAISEGSDWQLVFPDTQHPEYDQKWNGDLQTWSDSGYPVVTHKTINAQELWDAIVEAAWTNGEPGVWFIDSANQMSNSHYLGRLNCTNPCFEEPLPSFGVCCLGSLNLPVFIKDDDVSSVRCGHESPLLSPHGGDASGQRRLLLGEATFRWEELEKAITTAVRFLDNVIDVTPYFHSEIENLQKNERRIGLGTMGLAEALIRLGLRYGSEESLVFIDKLYSFIARSAYLASVELA